MRDCLRLARGMTYKAAVAGLNLGGAKSVIIGDPATDKTEELLLAHGRFIESLAGRYVPGIDMGTTQDDLRVMGRVRREVFGVGDDPSPKTALGVFTALQATAERLFGTPGLGGRTVAIQGAGHVGETLAELASHAGLRRDPGADPPDRVQDHVQAAPPIPIPGPPGLSRLT